MSANKTVDVASANEFAAADNKPSSWTSAFGELLCYLYHQKLPSVGDPHVSITGAGLVVLRSAVLVLLASTPIWRQLGKEEFEFSRQDIFLVLFVAFLLLVNWGVDRLLNKKARSKLADKLETDASLNLADTLRRINTLSGGLSKSKHSEEELTALLRDILKCIEYKIRLFLQKADKYYFNVSLITFSNAGATACVRARSNQRRRTVDDLRSEDTVAYYIARFQRVKIINDFQRQKIFPARGLSADAAPYRSILFLPLEPIVVKSGSESQKLCQAVVTVDSEKPYEFWSATETNIEIQMRPFLDELRMALAGHKSGVPINDCTDGSVDR